MVKTEDFLKSLNVSRETIAKLQDYQNLAIKWNQSINLFSNTLTQTFWQRHIIDSLQLLNYIKTFAVDIIDVGSGGGMPGIILSIAGIKKVTLIESDTRKSAFLLQAAQLSSNKIEVINARVEDLRLSCDILTARAFAELEKIFALTKNITIRDKYLLLKGKNFQQEIDKAKVSWDFDCKAYHSITSEEGRILAISKLTNLNATTS